MPHSAYRYFPGEPYAETSVVTSPLDPSGSPRRGNQTGAPRKMQDRRETPSEKSMRRPAKSQVKSQGHENDLENLQLLL